MAKTTISMAIFNSYLWFTRPGIMFRGVSIAMFFWDTVIG